jgi:hypothetical protein
MDVDEFRTVGIRALIRTKTRADRGATGSHCTGPVDRQRPDDQSVKARRLLLKE